MSVAIAMKERANERAAAGVVDPRDHDHLALWVAKSMMWGLCVNIGWDDIVQQARIGLMRACEKFEPERGVKFSFYAKYWIRQSIQRYIETHRYTVAIPGQVQRTQHKLTKERHRRASCGESTDIRDVAESSGVRQVTAQNVSAVQRPRFKSMDVHQYDDGSETVGAFMVSGEPSQQERYREEEEKLLVRRALEKLPKRYRAILTMRYEEDKTYPEIGAAVGVSRERIRQQLPQAIDALRDAMIRLGYE